MKKSPTGLAYRSAPPRPGFGEGEPRWLLPSPTSSVLSTVHQRKTDVPLGDELTLFAKEAKNFGVDWYLEVDFKFASFADIVHTEVWVALIPSKRTAVGLKSKGVSSGEVGVGAEVRATPRKVVREIHEDRDEAVFGLCTIQPAKVPLLEGDRSFTDLCSKWGGIATSVGACDDGGSRLPCFKVDRVRRFDGFCQRKLFGDCRAATDPQGPSGEVGELLLEGEGDREADCIPGI